MKNENLAIIINMADKTKKETKKYLESKIEYYQELVQKTIIAVPEIQNA